MAIPAIQALSSAVPNAALDVFVGDHSRPVFATSCRVRELIRLPDRITMTGSLRLASLLAMRRYSWVVILERSRLLRHAAAAAFTARVASVTTIADETRHESIAYLDVVRALGVDVSAELPKLSLDAASTAAAECLAPFVTRSTVVLQPGGGENPGSVMLDKRWPASYYVNLIERLRGRGVDFVLTGGRSDVARCGEIARAAGLPAERVLAGRADLLTAAAVVARAGLYIGGDTGMSHVAAAVGTPTVAIFMVTNPHRYRPLGERVRVVAPAEAYLIPDRDLRARARRDHQAAIHQPDVDEVMAAVDDVLGNRASV